MSALNYDSNKLPLGKLSANTLQKGNSLLKEISEVLAESKLAQSKYGFSSAVALETLTSRYYTVIPHVFGRNVPPIIKTVDRLKREAELIESLGEMEIAAEIISNVTKCPLIAADWKGRWPWNGRRGTTECRRSAFQVFAVARIYPQYVRSYPELTP